MPRIAVLALAVPIALVLGWRVVVVGMAALSERNLLESAPMAGAPPGATGADAALRERLARNPADARVLLALGIEHEREGRREDAAAAIRAGLRLAPADPQLLLLAAGYFLRTGEDAQALATLRRAVDSSPGEVGHTVWPVFAAALVTGRHLEFFQAIARDNPSWWPGFFQFACGRASAGGLQTVYAARVAAGLATTGEQRCLIERLQRDGQWTAAYQIWLNGLPPGQRQRVGYVFNGGFELPLTNMGFDWMIPVQDNVVVSSEHGEGITGQRALKVTFVNQRYGGPPVQQYLLLVPGRYRLEGRASVDLEAWLGLQWALYCREGPGRETKQLVHTEAFVGSTRWREFQQDFAIPASCPAQILRLELANPKQGATLPGTVPIRLKGTVWFDDVRVRIVD